MEEKFVVSRPPWCEWVSIRTTMIVALAAVVGLVLSGCGGQSSYPQPSYPVESYTEYSNGTPMATEVVTETPNNSMMPCGPLIGPNVTSLVPGPALPLPDPPLSVFRTDQPDPAGVGVVLVVGNCETGAIVTITPPDAATVEVQFYAADGGLAIISITGQPGRNYLVQAWSDADGTYLGEYVGNG